MLTGTHAEHHSDCTGILPLSIASILGKLCVHQDRNGGVVYTNTGMGVW